MFPHLLMKKEYLQFNPINAKRNSSLEFCRPECSTVESERESPLSESTEKSRCEQRVDPCLKYVQCVICLDIYRPLVEVFASGLITPSVEEKERGEAQGKRWMTHPRKGTL